MSRPIKQFVRRALVVAVSVVAAAVLTLPATGSPVAADSSPASPSPRYYMGMANDTARGQVVLFGGYTGHDSLGDTWTWDGSDWTQQHPAHAPSPRTAMGMVFDAALGQVVLFGGQSFLNDIWTWDGTDWTEHTPLHSPPGRYLQALTYDAARGQVLLFGGYDGYYHDDTWTWDGTDWTERTPAHAPSARTARGGLTYDAARGQVVLFGGYGGGAGALDDTWTWDGTDWTKRTPAHIPRARGNPATAYDAARSQVVLFGGLGAHYLNSTWTWDGTDWTKRTPPHAPISRFGMGMAFDAARGQVVLFGGNYGGVVGDTWTWDGTDWVQHPGGSLAPYSIRSGPPGTQVWVNGWGFLDGERVRLMFVDSVHGRSFLKGVRTYPETGGFTVQVTIPLDATPGRQRIKARGLTSRDIAKLVFTVT